LLLDELARLAAATGAAADVVGGPAEVAEVRRSWGTAPLVLVGADCADALARLQLQRRRGIVLVDRVGGAEALERALCIGAEQVCALPADRDRLVDLLGTCADGPAGAPVICVVGGCGGAGASVFAAGLAAAAAAAGSRSLLVDGDPLGGGLDLLVGGEHVDGLRWADLTSTSGRLSASTLRDLLPSVRRLSVLSWAHGSSASLPAASMQAVLSAGQRGHDVVVVDLPRRFDAAAECAFLRAALTVVVVTTEVRGVAAARSVVRALAPLTSSQGLVLRRTGGSGLDPALVADSLGPPVLATMRSERHLTESVEQGLGPLRHRRGQLGRACGQVLADVDRRQSAVL
jgi:secretion/DNA translocation related CpaE-like protein